MIFDIIALLFFLLVPAAVVYLCRKVSFFGKIGAVLTLYFIGIIVSNLFIFPVPGLGERLYPLQDALTSATIPLAMPLILFACDFRHWPFKSAFKSLVVGIVSVALVVIAGYFIFRNHLGEEASSIAGLAVGVYTGGTPNLASLKMMLDVGDSTYIIMNSFDMAVSFLYLVFLMSFGIRLFRKAMPSCTESFEQDVVVKESSVTLGDDRMYCGLFSREHFIPTLKALGLAAIIAGVSLGLSFAISGKINMVILILSLTTFAIAASFLPSVRKMEKSYDAGMYLVLVFSLVVASMVDVRSIDFGRGVWILVYIGFVIFASLILQVLLGIILKVDADTTVITSVALVNSPLFVPMIAESMKNRKVIITGIAVGIIGYALGNYLGVLIAGIL